jgi:hypothetical protein
LNVLDKEKLIAAMEKRYNSLNDQLTKDFTGDIQSRIHEFRELKYWKEFIERGEVDVKVWTND